MAPLNAEEMNNISVSVKGVLLATPYTCSSLSRMTGGTANFTFRGIFDTPLTLSGGELVTTAVIKKATGFAAINKNFALDARRSVCFMSGNE